MVMIGLSLATSIVLLKDTEVVHQNITLWVMMQSYPTRALDRRLQIDWDKDAREVPRVLMSLRVDFGPMG